MAIAALDVGRRRIGVAIAEDAAGATAYPIGAIARRSLARDFEAIGSLLRPRDVKQIVVGLPLNMDGSVGPHAHAAQDFARRLEAAIGIPVSLYDERLSSFEAEERLKESSRKARHSKNAIDAVAAAVILEGWLLASRNPTRDSG
jgi:putative holliday junction resolvase